MVTQQAIYGLMKDSRESPEIAEAAYLAAKHLKPKQIDRNLRIRYGSGQGFARFKEQLLEATEYNAFTSESSQYGAQVELHIEEESTRLDRITTEDVDVDLDKVICDGFEQIIAGQLHEGIQESLPVLSQDAKTVAYILRQGYDLGTWATRDEPDTGTVWQLHTTITGDTPTDPMQKDIIEELVQAGCIYIDNQDIILSPGFTSLEDPYKHLPHIEVTYQK